MLDPKSYEESKRSTRTANPVSDLLDKLSWRPNERILDYGCGSGYVSRNNIIPRLEGLNCVVDGVDVSSQMIQYAKEQAESGTTTTVHYNVGDIMAEEQQFVLSGVGFDKIILVHVLNWISDARGALNKFYNILNPGGHLTFIVGSGGYLQSKLLNAFGADPKWAEAMKGYKDYAHMSMYDSPEETEKYYEAALTEIRFKFSEFRTVDFDLEPAPLEEFVGFYVSLNPYLSRVNDVQALKDDYLKYLIKFMNLPRTSALSDLAPRNYKLLTAIVQKQ